MKVTLEIYGSGALSWDFKKGPDFKKMFGSFFLFLKWLFFKVDRHEVEVQ